MTYTCPTCGAANGIVNQCRCDPNNLPTRVWPDLQPVPRAFETFHAILSCGNVRKPGRIVAEVYGEDPAARERFARLVAWSPRVLASLEELSNWMRDHTGPGDGAHDMLVRAVLALQGVAGVAPVAGAPPTFDPSTALKLVADEPARLRAWDVDRLADTYRDQWPTLRAWLLAQPINPRARAAVVSWR
jgi:hypothetical protein